MFLNGWKIIFLGTFKFYLKMKLIHSKVIDSPNFVYQRKFGILNETIYRDYHAVILSYDSAASKEGDEEDDRTHCD